jgi:hypothetical protein
MSNVGRQQTRGSGLPGFRVQSEQRSLVVIARAEVRVTLAVRPPGDYMRVGLRLARLQRPACVALAGCLRAKCLAARGRRSLNGSGLRPVAGCAPIAESRGCLSRAALAKCGDQSRGERVPQLKGQSAEATLAPNPSFERTPYSGLRPLPGAAQLER